MFYVFFICFYKSNFPVRINAYAFNADAEKQSDDGKDADNFALHRGEKSGAL